MTIPVDTTPILDRLAAGTLARRRWTGTDAQGRHIACLLATVAPVCGERKDPTACPADIMPEWLAHLTPCLDDAPSEEAWPGVVTRYAVVLRDLHLLNDAALRRCDYGVRRAALLAAREQAGNAAAVVNAVIGLCDRAIAGDEPAGDEWASASTWAAQSLATASGASAVVASAAPLVATQRAARAARATVVWAARWAGVDDRDRIVSDILAVLEGEIASAQALMETT